MNEKQQIEKATADGFLTLYNELTSSNYIITEVADAPDVRCKDALGNELNLEITLTEDRAKDIQAALGRSNHRDFDNRPLGEASSLSNNVIEHVMARMRDKSVKRYGLNTALVIRHTSGVDWDWNLVIEDIATGLKHEHNPFDKGVWILNLSKTRLFHVL